MSVCTPTPGMQLCLTNTDTNYKYNNLIQMYPNIIYGSPYYDKCLLSVLSKRLLKKYVPLAQMKKITRVTCTKELGNVNFTLGKIKDIVGYNELFRPIPPSYFLT